jgi:hypothetical protein
LLKEATRRTIAVMANDDDKEPPPPPQPPVWVPDQMWNPPPMRRNNALFESQPAFVPPPLQQSVWVPVPHQQRNNVLYESSNFVPPPTEPPSPPADARGEEINASFKEVERCQADLASAMDRLRNALPTATAREIGPGHNQGPPLEDLVWADAFIELLKDEGPRIKTAADAKHLIEQTEKVKQLPDRIWAWLKAAGWLVAGVGAHKVTEDLTAPLWDDVAHKIVDLCHAIEVWVSLLPLH